VPEPSVLPRQLPRSIGPAGAKIAGTPAEIAPINSAGVVLSQPPISTTASIGWLRISSSQSIARRLRYSIVVGFTMGSDRLSAGNSTGIPPACNTPRFTHPTRSGKWAWHMPRSDQVLRMPITGRSFQSSSS
jgi:hypothetical protein